MTAVFDLDDTLSIHKNRDYANALPIPETIERIRELKAAGWDICIYSARGQHSCNGDLRLIEERNRAVVEKWLDEHNVPFDDLVFGKPLGDLYIDDKGMALEDFLKAPIEMLHGNSGADIQRVGNRIIKHGPKAAETASWYAEAAQLGVRTPKVSSVVLDTIYIEYIDGTRGDKYSLSHHTLWQIISIIMRFSLVKGYSFNKRELIRRAREHLSVYRLTSRQQGFEHLFDYIDRAFSESDGSFCHGDLALSNIIFEGTVPCLIDPIPNTPYSSFLMDFAKLRFSMDGGEDFLHGVTTDYTEIIQTLDNVLKNNGWLEKVIALEATYWIRLIKYTPAERREAVVDKALELQGWL